MAGNINQLIAAMQHILGDLNIPHQYDNRVLRQARAEYNESRSARVRRRVARDMLEQLNPDLFGTISLVPLANQLQADYEAMDSLRTYQQTSNMFERIQLFVPGDRVAYQYTYRRGPNAAGSNFLDILTAFYNRYRRDIRMFARRVSVTLIVNGAAVNSTPTMDKGNLTLARLLRRFRIAELYDGDNPMNELAFAVYPRVLPGGRGGPITGIGEGVLNFGSVEYCGHICLFIASKPKRAWTTRLNRMIEADILIKSMKKYFAKLGLPVEPSLRWDEFARYTDRKLFIISDEPKVLYMHEGRPDPIYIYFNDGHYTLISDLRKFLLACDPDTKYELCKCNEIHRWDHDCDKSTYKCEYCAKEYKSMTWLEMHRKTWVNEPCPQCNEIIHYEACVHRCRKPNHMCYCYICMKQVPKIRYPEHNRNGHLQEEQCPGCDTYYNRYKVHACDIPKVVAPQRKRNYYAYDIECFQEPDGKQTFALLCITSLDNPHEDMKVFDDAAAFHRFVTGIPNTSVLFAHNAKGYDSLILLEEFLRLGETRVSDVIAVGKKIYQFRLCKVLFWDSANHIQARLEDFPRMFNLPDYAKGVFPYDFFTKEHKDFVGVVPPEYYPAKYRTLPHIQEPVNLWELAREYCMMDTVILAKGLAAYRDANMAREHVDPLASMTKAGDALNTFRRNYLNPGDFQRITPHLTEQFIEDSFMGGRCECFVPYYMCKDGEKIVSDDVSSMYPAVQALDPLPGKLVSRDMFGTPLEDYVIDANFVRESRGSQALETFGNGEGKVDICHRYVQVLLDWDYVFFLTADLVPARKYIPVLGMHDEFDSKLKFTLRPMKQVTVYSEELKLALREGYKITKIYGSLVFTKVVGGFRKYIDTFYKQKNAFKKEGGAAYQGAKIKLNSLWGKFAQSNDWLETEFVTSANTERTFEIIKMDMEKKLEIRLEHALPDRLGTMYRYSKERKYLSNNRLTTHIASAITACARVRLYEGLNKLYLGGKKVLYCDTDSVYYVTNEDDNTALVTHCETNDVLGYGKWEREINDGKEFVCPKPKSYAIQRNTGDVYLKACGYVLGGGNLTIDDYRRLIVDREASAGILEEVQFRRGYIGVHVTKNNVKNLKYTHDKRYYYVSPEGKYRSSPLR